jgi:16S rRNA G966 N2-methylase RsmD
MQMTDSLRDFIREHAAADVLQLILKASCYKNIDLRFAVEQITARRQVKDKLPLWNANDRLIFPSALAAEQCSSEQTAFYKQCLVGSEDVVFDLTGGLGVDSYFLSRKVRRVVYVERNAEYCETAIYNMKQLEAHNVNVLNGDAVNLIIGNTALATKEKQADEGQTDVETEQIVEEAKLMVRGNEQTIADAELLSAANVFYIDPARRGAWNRRLFAMEDCEPDLTKIWPLLCKKQAEIIVKLSPMFDISQVLLQLPEVTEIHIVSVKNDCKELLAIARGRYSSREMKSHDALNLSTALSERNRDIGKSDVRIYCVNFTSSGEKQSFEFGYDEEKTTVVSYAEAIDRYLYEPNVSILKAGAYKTVSSRYGLKKLHVNSHLYTSDTYKPSFSGRIFEVKDVYRFDNRLCRELSARIPQANISVRNFPLSVDELRKRTHITDGGDVYLFATTFADRKKVLIDCRKTNVMM